MSHIKHIKCDNKNCGVTREVDPLYGYTIEDWYSLYSNDVDIDLCSYKCLQEYVNSGGTQ